MGKETRNKYHNEDETIAQRPTKQKYIIKNMHLNALEIFVVQCTQSQLNSASFGTKSNHLKVTRHYMKLKLKMQIKKINLFSVGSLKFQIGNSDKF